MSGETALLPCPICGGQPDFQHFNITPNVQGRIICACGIELRQGVNDTEDDMRIIWNTRTDYAAQAENERKAEQAVAATLGSDDEYEAKMDALLCRLTKGKWSKSRSYDLDFMVSCVEEEFEAADLENGTYKRIAELEELIRIMWLYLSDPETEFPCCIPICERLREDMRALGIEVDE